MRRPAGRRYRRTALPAAAVLLGAGALQAPAAGDAPAPLEVTEGRAAAPPELPAAVADTLDAARSLTERYPDDLGYAWVDRRTNTVVVDAATPAGVAKATDFAPALRRGVPQTVRSVRFSQAHLARIQNEAIELTSADVPDGELIHRTEPDAEGNRVLVTVERRSEALLDALAARYGTAAIAVRVDPDRARRQARHNDTSPYYGGGRIAHQNGSTCTAAFGWYSGSTNAMLTAGHCAPTGGWIYAGTPSASTYMGSVANGSRESWNTGVGTVYMTNQGTYRGDIAFIQVDPTKNSAARMFRGGPTSTTAAIVMEMWHRRPVIGDKYCVGGATTGEMCGWGITAVNISHRYDDGTVVRPAVIGTRYGSCTRPGDSGGPVYTVRTDGGISAKGIHSGGNDAGGDWYGSCFTVFTDIYEAYYGFPGYLKIE